MKRYLIIATLPFCLFLSACAAKPEKQIEDNTEKSVEAAAQIPSHIQDTVSCADGSEQEIDADVVWDGDTSLHTGQIHPAEFNVTDFEEVFSTWTDPGHGEFFEDGATFSYYDNRYGEDAENYDMIEDGYIPPQLEDFLDQMNQDLGTHQMVKECDTAKLLPDGEEIYEFYTAVGIDNIPVIEKLDANSLEFNGSGRMLMEEGKLIDLMVTDFEVCSSDPAECMDPDTMVKYLEDLLQQGIIEPVSSGQPINQIRLCYMTEMNEEGFEFYPAVAFYTSYVAESLKGMTAEFAHRYIVLDARDGSLVDYNTWR